MRGYTWVAILLNFAVNTLLLLGAGRLCGAPIRVWRYILGATIGSIHSGLCLLPQLNFLGNPLWYTVSLAGMALVSYGLYKRTVRCGAVFAVLSLALIGISSWLGDGSVSSVLAAAIALGVLCVIGFRGRGPGSTYVPVEIRNGDAHVRLTALRDTGNMLRDPITGQPVLVIGAEAAGKLTGLTREQLRSPVESVAVLPGLRLVSYRSVGNGAGLMLALRFQNVRIGTWKGSSLVAFAPEGLGADGPYEALTGGAA